MCDQGILTTAPLRDVRFIDLEEERLVEYDSLGRGAVRYATVSYNWGRESFCV